MDQATLEKTLTEIFGKEVGNIKSDLETVIEEKFKKFVEENKLDKSNFKHSMFPVAGGEDETKTKYERIGSFVKAVFQKDVTALTKAMNEGQDSAGGFLVPPEFVSEVHRIANDYGLARKLSLRFPMSSNELNVPTDAGSVTVTFPGEATAGTESSPTLGNVPLLTKTMMGVTVMSNEFLKDSKADIMKYLMTLIAEEFAGSEDNQAFNGTGAPFTGILVDSGVTTVTMASGKDTFAEATLADYRDLISNVKATVLPTSAFFMHRLTWGLVQKITENSQSVPSFQNPIAPVGNLQPGLLQPAGYLWGFPVYLSDKIVSTTAVSTKFVAFGSMAKGLFFGDRETMAMDISNQGSVGNTNLFTSNQSGVRITQRIAIKVGLPTAFAVLKTAAS